MQMFQNTCENAHKEIECGRADNGKNRVAKATSSFSHCQMQHISEELPPPPKFAGYHGNTEWSIIEMPCLFLILKVSG